MVDKGRKAFLRKLFTTVLMEESPATASLITYFDINSFTRMFSQWVLQDPWGDAWAQVAALKARVFMLKISQAINVKSLKEKKERASRVILDTLHLDPINSLIN